jgi:hypothetical protein
VNKSLITQTRLKGWTEKRLINRPTLFRLLQKEGVRFSFAEESILIPDANGYVVTLEQIVFEALNFGLSKKVVDRCIDKSSKLLFQTNRIWSFFKKVFNIDLRIPLIAGYFTVAPIKANLVTTRGKQAAVEQINGVTTSPMTAIAIGVDNTAASASQTALISESTTNGTARGAATTSSVTTSTTNDTAQWVKTFTITGTFAIVEEGIFDNNSSGGNMLARQVFSAVNVVSGDSLQITHKVQAS